jgi:hypothetical protein
MMDFLISRQTYENVCKYEMGGNRKVGGRLLQFPLQRNKLFLLLNDEYCGAALVLLFNSPESIWKH